LAQKVAIEPGSSHIGVIPMDGLQIREDLRVKRLARDLTHVDHTAGLFFPQRHPMFEASPTGPFGTKTLIVSPLYGLFFRNAIRSLVIGASLG
jgi:hypothetical protein